MSDKKDSGSVAVDKPVKTPAGPAAPSMMKRLFAEFLGTFWLVLGGCGSAVLAAKFLSSFPDSPGGPKQLQLGIGLLGVSLAFGLTVLTMAYAMGHISGGHFNPAVTLGVATAGRFPWRETPAYIGTQIVGAIAAAGVLYVIATGKAGFDVKASGFATNGFDAASPGGYSMVAALVTEVVMTAFFLFIILGSTDSRAPKGMAPLAIGLGLTLIHLISIPVTNTSVNPARSIGPALFVGGTAVEQLWLFIVAPIVGAVLAGAMYGFLAEHRNPASLEEASEA